MPSISLPDNPSLENLKKQAKRFLDAVRAGDAEAIASVREFHPKGEQAVAGFSLSDAQLVSARRYGFASWPKLKKHLETLDEYTWSPPPETDSPADRFIRLACVDYDSWNLSYAEKARRFLAEHPEVARENIYTAAAAGDIAAVRDMLAREPALASARGGPNRWDPLLYACYSRINSSDPNHSTLEVARLLLDAGADPNAGFLWRGLLCPFTALTGAFGGGEAGVNNPPHRDCNELARLLLDAGADPNDEQTLYNRGFERNDDHLKILFSYGLGRDQGGPWFKRLDGRLRSPEKMVSEEVWSAARRNRFDRLKLLVENGADVNTPGFRDGRTPYEAALRAGNGEIAEYLAEHGAKRVSLNDAEVFAAALTNGRRAEAMALIEKDPKRIEKLGHHGRIELLHRAVEMNHPEGILLMAELGFEISDTTKHDGVGANLAATPLHAAAWTGHLGMVKLLIGLGANPDVRDPNYHATPLGWAAYNGKQHVVDYLLDFASIFDAVRCGGFARVRALLEKDPSLATALDSDGDPVIFYVQANEEMLSLLIAHGADINARHHSGQTLLEQAVGRGDDALAEALGRHGAG